MLQGSIRESIATGHQAVYILQISVQIKKWSRPVSRVLSWTAIPLDAASPRRSSDQPGNDAGRIMVPLFGLAPGGVCRAGPSPDSRCALTAPFHPCLIPCGPSAVSFCCTFRRLAPPRRYLAPCPVEPGLSSAPLRMTRLSGRLRVQFTALRTPHAESHRYRVPIAADRVPRRRGRIVMIPTRPAVPAPPTPRRAPHSRLRSRCDGSSASASACRSVSSTRFLPRPGTATARALRRPR